MKCYHDPVIECKFNGECHKCPIIEAIMSDYPH